MNNKIIGYVMIATILQSHNVVSKMDTSIQYPTYKDSPGYNTGVQVKDHKFDGVKAILFTPNEDTVTGDDSNKNVEAYFWEVKDPDKTLTYPGKAKIGNSQYINVVAIDSKKLNTEDDSNSVVSTGSEDVYHPTNAQKKLFDDNFLVPIGTFMKPNDPTVYTLLGQYLSTTFPDPRVVGTTGPNGSVSVVDQTTGDVGAAQ